MLEFREATPSATIPGCRFLAAPAAGGFVIAMISWADGVVTIAHSPRLEGGPATRAALPFEISAALRAVGQVFGADPRDFSDLGHLPGAPPTVRLFQHKR